MSSPDHNVRLVRMSPLVARHDGLLVFKDLAALFGRDAMPGHVRFVGVVELEVIDAHVCCSSFYTRPRRP